MTAFQINQEKARAQAAELLSRYGLEIIQSTTGSYTDRTLQEFACRFFSKAQPVKGNKSVIEALRSAGVEVYTWRDTIYNGPGRPSTKVMKFWAVVTIKIKTQEVQK